MKYLQWKVMFVHVCYVRALDQLINKYFLSSFKQNCQSVCSSIKCEYFLLEFVLYDIMLNMFGFRQNKYFKLHGIWLIGRGGELMIGTSDVKPALVLHPTLFSCVLSEPDGVGNHWVSEHDFKIKNVFLHLLQYLSDETCFKRRREQNTLQKMFIIFIKIVQMENAGSCFAWQTLNNPLLVCCCIF